MSSDVAVARVQSLSHIGPQTHAYGFSGGQFFPLWTGGSSPGPTRVVPGVVLRGGVQSQFAILEIDMLLQIGDVIMTGPATIAAIEFLIGGRVGINRSSVVEIFNEREMADGKGGFGRVASKTSSMWTKADAQKLKQPIEIQTNGGVMGIKG